MKKQSVTIPIFNSEYKVIVCWGDIAVVRRTMKVWGYPLPLAESKDIDSKRGVTFYSSDCHPLIALPKYPKTASEIGTLAHEATHAVINVFDKIAERNFDEVFAHSVGAVVRGVLEHK